MLLVSNQRALNGHWESLKGLPSEGGERNFQNLKHQNTMSIENRENGHHAVTTIDGKEVYLEDLIMNPGSDETVIHLNGNTLDNRRANLKIVKKLRLN
jgi:hypothetical protein